MNSPWGDYGKHRGKPPPYPLAPTSSKWSWEWVGQIALVTLVFMLLVLIETTLLFLVDCSCR